MKTSETTSIITKLWEMSEHGLYVPLLIWGEAGVGKSDTVKAAARELDIDFVDLRLGNLEAPDLMGLMRDEQVYPCVLDLEEGKGDPVRTGERFTASGLWHHVRLHHLDKIPDGLEDDPKGFVEWNRSRLEKLGYASFIETRTVYSSPGWFPAPGSAGILFLDEMNRSSRETRQGVFQLVLDRRIHELELPPRWIVVSANNPSSSTAEGGMSTYADVDQEMEEDKAFMTRFMHVVFDASASEWADWAVRAGVESSIVSMLDPANSNDERVRKLLGLRSALLPVLEPTPRGWTALSRVLQGMPDLRGVMLSDVVRGLVGDECRVPDLQGPPSDDERNQTWSKILVATKFVDFLSETRDVDPTGRSPLPKGLTGEKAYLAMETCLDLLVAGDPAGQRMLQELRGALPDDELSLLDDMLADVVVEPPPPALPGGERMGRWASASDWRGMQQDFVRRTS